MPNRPVAVLTRKSIVSSVVLAGLTSLALLGRVESLSAAAMTPCQIKHSFCSERCIMNSESEGKGNACLQRTCDHQFKACAAISGEPMDTNHGRGPGLSRPLADRPIVERPPRKPKPRPGRRPRGGDPVELTSQSPGGPAGQVRGPRWGGILDNVGGFRQQGPAATGSPMAPRAPSTPPVILR